MHLIKEFLIYSYNEQDRRSVKQSWKMKEIKARKVNFISDIKESVKAKNNVYWKGYCKVKLFEHDDLAETMQDLKGRNKTTKHNDPTNPDTIAYQYIEVYKYYNMHLDDGKKLESYSHQPLGSLVN